MFSNSYILEIIKIIKERKELNPSELIIIMNENYNCSVATIYRLLTLLVDNKVINLKIHKRNQKYYYINNEYFNHVLAIDDTGELHKYMNFINSILLPNEDYKKIIELLSNDYVLPILMIIKECKQVNSAKIIEKISTKYNCSNSTVYRIITMLLENKVIYISKRSSNKIYYSINEPYFINAEQEMSTLLHYFIDKSDKK